MSVLFSITTLTAVAEDLDNNRNSALVYSLLSEEGVFQEARPGEAASKRFSVDATSGDIIVSRQVSCDWWSRDTAAQYSPLIGPGGGPHHLHPEHLRPGRGRAVHHHSDHLED